MGGDGGICAATHLRPEAFVRAGEAVTDGDVAAARTEQFDAIDPVFRPCMDDGFAPVCKALLAERDVVETDTVRPPLVPLPDEDRRALADTLGD